jgi:hypothetical protein
MVAGRRKRSMYKRANLSWAVACIALALTLFAGPVALPDPCFGGEVAETGVVQPGSVDNIAEAFIGEELIYKIGFWLLDDVATGTVTMKKAEKDGEYVATLSAQTTGFLGWLLKGRKDTYVAHLRLADGGKRFVTTTFEKSVDRGGKVRRGRRVLDYEKGEMTWRSWGGGKGEREGVEKIPPGVWIDGPLAAFYNFRAGVYGPVEGGRSYSIRTFPKDGRVPEITLKVATREELEKRVPKDKAYADYLADARIDKDLFGQKEGDIEILFTSDMLPVEAVAKDLIFFGDVRGKLTGLGVGMDFKKTASAGR